MVDVHISSTMAHTTIIRHEGHQRHIDTKADNPGALPSSSATRKDDGVDERYGRSSVRGSSSSSLLLLFFFLLPSFLLLLLLPFSLLFSSPSFSSSLLPPSSLLLLPLSLSPCSFFLFLSPPCSSSSSCGRLGWGGEGARRGQRGELGGERCNTPVLCLHLGIANHTYRASSSILFIHA